MYLKNFKKIGLVVCSKNWKKRARVDFQKGESLPIFSNISRTKHDKENPRSSWTSLINSINYHIKAATNIFDLDLDRLAILTTNNTFWILQIRAVDGPGFQQARPTL